MVLQFCLETLSKLMFHSLFVFCVVLTILKVYIILRASQKKNTTIAFFHPYCNSAGGGQKVLWSMIYGLISSDPEIRRKNIYIYTGDVESQQAILTKAKNRFELDLLQYSESIIFVRVGGRRLLQPFRYFTMGFQILGTILYAVFCCLQCQPDVFIDTTGFSFSYIVVKVLLPKAKIIAYVHYPFISHDMLDRVVKGENAFNNSKRIADNPTLKKAQIFYYKFLLFLYEQLGKLTDLVFTNSSWTDNHMKSLWKSVPPINMIKLYPPCNIKNLLTFGERDNKEISIMSFAQFRPEQYHMNQIQIFESVAARLQQNSDVSLKFYMTGSCRAKDDELLLENLQAAVQERGLEKQIVFQVNQNYQNLQAIFQTCSIGIHTMEAQHFGIAVVEMMAAGLIVLAHNSAGPQFDIIKDNEHGYLCESVENYTENLLKAIELTQNSSKRNELVQKARARVQSFSDENFIKTSTMILKSKFKIWKLA